MSETIGNTRLPSFARARATVSSIAASSRERSRAIVPMALFRSFTSWGIIMRLKDGRLSTSTIPLRS